ncbi:MAG: endolytic transglycosylase MltG [Dyella sp.]
MRRAGVGGRIRWTLLIVLLLMLAALGYLGWDYARFVRTPLAVRATGDIIEIARGSNFKEVVAQLRQQDVSHANALYWRVLAEQMHVAGKLHAGEYALAPGMTPGQLLQTLAQGKVLQRLFTIVDGWNLKELRAALAKAPKLEHASQGLDDAALMRKLGDPASPAEGQFLPESYAYVLGDSDLDILRRAHAAMERTLATLWPKRAVDLPLESPYQALILASIVEKETGRADERARIAGVFVRRLQKHMLLQTDPTVIYGMGDRYAGVIHKVDLTTDTPYNTYTRAGLPPTPIAMPGLPALQAALHPAPGDDLYFVARGDGGHVFASTLEQHNRNVACYQLKHCP